MVCCDFVTGSNTPNVISREIVLMDDFFETCKTRELFRIQRDLQLTTFELFHHHYPFPIDDGFISLPIPSSRCNVSPPNMFGLDCEMIITRAPNGSLWKELARVSVVNHNLQVIFDVLVKPQYEISDYLTQYSGLTAEIMTDAELSLEDVQKMFTDRFDTTTIFVGHSLEQDLRALRIYHFNIIDTAVLHCRKFACTQKPKLKFLCALHLNRLIQTGVGHDSVEDAKAAMILALYFLIDSSILGRYHLPHGIEASKFFESSEQFYQINIIPSMDHMLWLESFVACLTSIINTASEKHPHLSFQMCPYYYFMPNFEVNNRGQWGGTFFIGVAQADPNMYKAPCKSSNETLKQTLNSSFDNLVKRLKDEDVQLHSFLLKQSEVPIWVWQSAAPQAPTQEDSAQGGSENEENGNCTILPSPTPPSSCEEGLRGIELPPFELDAPNLEPSSTPTSSPANTPDDIIPMAPLKRADLNKLSKKKQKRKSRWKRRKRRNKKKAARESA